MTIKKSEFKQKHTQVRKWAKSNKQKIYEKLGMQCFQCGELDKEKLTIHHKKYEIGLYNVEVLCNDCHRKHHDLELQKKILILLLHDFKVNNINNNITIGEYKHQLWERIDKIPVEISVKGVNGFDFDFDKIIKEFCYDSIIKEK